MFIAGSGAAAYSRAGPGAGLAGSGVRVRIWNDALTNEHITREIGRRLAQRRRDLDLSLADVAARCGVSLQQVHKYERAQSTVSAPMLYRLSRCLGVPISYFFVELDTLAEIAEPA